MLDHEQQDELKRLVAELREETISPDDADRLQAILSASSEALDYYVGYMSLCADMHWALADDEQASESNDVSPVVAVGSPSLGDRMTAFFSQPLNLSISAAVFAVACMVVSLSLIFPGTVEPEVQPVANGSGEAAQLPRFSNAAAVARITQIDDARWASGASQAVDGQELAPGTAIHLTRGVVHLTFASGAQAVLHAPVHFDVQTRNGGYLLEGYLTATVPPPAAGFAVATQSVEVVDRGTRFGMLVHPESCTDVAVYEGTVDARSRRRGASVGPVYQMLANEQRRFHLDGISDPLAAGSATLDAEQMHPMISKLPATDAYAAEVLASKPTCYWRFDRTDSRGAADSGSSRLHARKTGHALIEGAGRNQWAVLPRLDQPNGFAVDSPPKRFWADDFSVEMWFHPDGYQDGVLLEMTTPSGSPEKVVHPFKIQLVNATRTTRRAKSLRVVYRGPDGTSKGNSDLYSETSYQPHRWQHVVVTTQNRTLRIYYNGLFVGQREVGERIDCDLENIHIGYSMLESARRTAVGALDEVALYARAIQYEEVKRHYQAMGRNP